MSKTYKALDLQDIGRIPSELVKLKNWVCWGPRGATDKAPIDAKTGLAAKSTDRSTWSTLLECVQCYTSSKSSEKLNGIGFVFSKEDNLTGIDLDNCRDPESGAINREAQAIIKKLNSYAEASPSGTGVHIIVKACIPKGRKKSTIEMYSDARYFCFTGNALSKDMNVESRQAEIDALYAEAFGTQDADVPQPAQKVSDDPLFETVRNIPDGELLTIISKNEKHFTALMQGDASSLSKDQSGSAADFALCCLLARYTRLDALRVDHIFRTSKLYRQKWDRRDGTYGTYGERTIKSAFAEVKKSKQALFDPNNLNEAGPVRLSDGTNTDLFIKITNNSFAYVTEWKTWLQWNGVYWKRGAVEEVMKAIRMVSDERWQQWRDNRDFKELAKWAKETDNYGRQSNIERWARYRLYVRSHILDQHPYLLACENGVVDLRTSTLRQGERTDYLTRGVEWSYVPTAECPIFDQFLEDIMQGDEGMVEYLWRVIGYALTGETGARAFFLLYGVGKNGKSTFVRALQALMGMRSENYAQSARFETFLQANRNGGNADPDMAVLAGARVVVASEVNPGDKVRLDGGKIKNLTGEDYIRARFLYSADFQFLPVCKIFMVVNDVPHIEETAQALYDRLHYVSFNYRVPPEKQDDMLHWKFIGEMEGILSKAVRYAAEWYETRSLRPPASVLKARETLAAEMDFLSDFFASHCVINAQAITQHSDLYREYLKYCEQANIKRPMHSLSLSKQMRKRGYQRFTLGQNHNVSWRGIGLRLVEEVII